jgi:hypothetical protein
VNGTGVVQLRPRDGGNTAYLVQIAKGSALAIGPDRRVRRLLEAAEHVGSRSSGYSTRSRPSQSIVGDSDEETVDRVRRRLIRMASWLSR